MDSIRDIWRQAALADTLQFYGPVALSRPPRSLNRPRRSEDERAKCAISILPKALRPKPGALPWTIEWLECPECHEMLWAIANLMAHLNDVHKWSWDMFANKFPSVLPEDQEAV